MKLRVYAVVLTLLAAGLSVAWWRERIERRIVADQATRLSRQNAELNFQLKQALKAKSSFEERAVALDNQLGSAKSRTTATETKAVQLTRELVETKTQLTEREQREVALMAELATLRQKVAAASPVDDAMVLPTLFLAPTRPADSSTPKSSPAPAAAHAPRVPSAERAASAEELAAYSRRITELEQQLTQLLTRALADHPAVTESSDLPVSVASPASRVVRVGPKDSFVVIDYGAEQGAKTGVFISLQRDGAEIARAQLSDARPKFSLAQVQASTLKGQLQTGDLVVFTH